ncbi:MAG TPA: hypothetical protein VGF61_19895 [Candidatus Acidoferrum sp.]|jgi:hypothetical protein
MKISVEQTSGASAEIVNPAANQVKNERVSTQSSTASTVEKAATTAATAIVTPAQRQTDVTFRRDNNGRVYYVVADARSGEEILEVPPRIVREVGHGIEEYLKQEQSKATPHIEVKA